MYLVPKVFLLKYTLSYLARVVNAMIVPFASESVIDDVEISGLANLSSAASNQLSFLANPAYKKHLPNTQAAAVLVTQAIFDEFSGQIPQGVALICDNPYLAYAEISALFDSAWQPMAGQEPLIHTSAVIHPSAQLGDSVRLGANVVIEAGVVLGDDVCLEAGCVVGRDSVIGAKTRLFANVSIAHGVVIGEQCIIHSGAVVGADGFGFAPHNKQWKKIHQIGGVIIGNNVEIGANTCIDRGALDDTRIDDGVKIDNLVHIAHNVCIGENTAIAALCGIAGSTSIGKRCTMGGQAGVAGHLVIADDVHMTAKSMVVKSISQAGVVSSGIPAAENRVWRKNATRFQKLDEMAQRLRALEKQLSKP